MILLLFYFFLAIGVSFFCSISEAVLLSLRPSYIAAMEYKKERGAKLLKELNSNLDKPLAAILTANTISHTVGAAGVGAQAATIFGNEYLAVISAVLTFMVLVFSEIIPKTIGATYWPQLAPSFAYLIKGLVIILAPFVWMSEKLTRLLSRDAPGNLNFSRDEMSAMAEIGKQEGALNTQEHKIATNLVKLNNLSVKKIMTPRTVIFSVSAELTTKEYFDSHSEQSFSRVPIYKDGPDDIIGYVLKADILIAQARDEFDLGLMAFRRDFTIVLDTVSALDVYEKMMQQKSQITPVVDEYGSVRGLITMEDVVETIIGLEITDELDQVEDMQVLAREKWAARQGQQSVE